MDCKTSLALLELPPMRTTSGGVFPRKPGKKLPALCEQKSAVLLGVFLLCAFCLCGSLLLSFSLLKKYGKLSEEVEKQSRKLEESVLVAKDVTQDYDITQKIKDSQELPILKRRFKRKSPKRRNNARGRRQRYRQKHRRQNPRNVILPATHLKGQSNEITNIANEDYYFLWRNPDWEFRNSFRYLQQQGDNSVFGIEVLKSGIYVIYSQIAIHGTRFPNIFKADCGHETVRTVNRSGKDVTDIILKSVLTQTNRGRGVVLDGHTNRKTYPLDTAVQMGIFPLKRKDKIFVRKPKRCLHVTYTMDPRYTYFGAFMLHPLN